MRIPLLALFFVLSACVPRPPICLPPPCAGVVTCDSHCECICDTLPGDPP